MYKLWFAEAPAIEHCIIKSSFMHSPDLHPNTNMNSAMRIPGFKDHVRVSKVESSLGSTTDGRQVQGWAQVYLRRLLGFWELGKQPVSLRRDSTRTQPPLALVLHSTDAYLSRVGQSVLQAYESIVHCSRLKRKNDPIPEPSQTIANFVAAISRASTSGVNRANAFFDPSGL